MAQPFPTIRRVFADQGDKAWFVDWAARWLSFIVEIVRKPTDQVGFQVHPKRWSVERTFGWFMNVRRLSKDYERDPVRSESMIDVAAIRLMLRRLTSSAS